METTKKNLEQANKDLEAKEKALQAVSEYCLMFVIILPVVWYGCETWSFTLGDERWLRVFENRVLRRIFRTKRDEVTGEWRKLHNEDLNDLYCSPNIIRDIKSRRMRWARQVARLGRGEGYIGFWWGNLRERDHSKDPGIDGRVILRWIFRRWGVGS